MTSEGNPEPFTFLKLLAHDLRWQLVTALSESDYRVQELVDRLGQPQNLVSYHLKQLRNSRLVSEHRSTADGRDIYYSLDLAQLQSAHEAVGLALHPALVGTQITNKQSIQNSASRPTKVLFLCTHNSARSQMAEGILRATSKVGLWNIDVSSAGTMPSSVHPYTQQVMAELGIDIGGQRSKSVNEFQNQTFDYIVTVCDRARENCPVFPDGAKHVHWSFPDPAAVEGEEARYLAFTQTARQLITRIRYFAASIHSQKAQDQ